MRALFTFRLGTYLRRQSPGGIFQSVSCSRGTLRCRERLEKVLRNRGLFLACHFFCSCNGAGPFCGIIAPGPCFLHVVISLLRYRAGRLTAASPQLFAAIQIRH